jgi:hypothetical protein
VDRTEASIAPARGGDRTDRGQRRRAPAGRKLAVLGIVALAAGSWWSPPAGAAGKPRTSHHAGTSGPALSLLAPPTVAGPSSPFGVRLGVSGTVPLTALTLSVTVYGPVPDLTEFDETLGGSPVGDIVASSGTFPVSSLPADPQGGVDLTVPVTAAGVTGAGTGPFTADLSCQLGSCGGVYPVLLKLTDTDSGDVTSRLLTYLVYTDPAGDIEPLRFALVVPLSLPASTVFPGDLDLDPASLATLANVMGALAGPRATMPLTIVPGPATVAALTSTGSARARTVLASMLSLIADPDHQVLCGSFVPVDASSLVSAALGGATEITQQIHRGVQVLDSIAGPRSAACTASNVWVAGDTLDAATIAALDSLGYDDLVVPPDAVSGPPPSTTPTRLFTLDGSTHPGNAVLSDPGLSALIQRPAHADPAQAAGQLLAELELDYYEAQNTPKARGVVVTPATTTSMDPAVVTDLLDGLQNNPMIEPVTLTTLFADVPVGGTVAGFPQPSSRRPATIAGPSGLPVRAIATARSQLTGYSAAVTGSPSGDTVAAALGDQLLGAESQELTPSEQSTAVGHFEDSFRRQLSLLSITSRQVRLTARTGSVPITVIKNASYPVRAVLTVTSDKIIFSAGGAQVPNPECRTPVVTNSSGRSSVSTLCTFIHGTNAVYIEMRSQVSGDFRMSVTLNSPAAGLQLASGELTVRSMSTSAVAIALTVAAGAVLLSWWGRTMWRNRRTRRGLHRQRGGGS